MPLVKLVSHILPIFISVMHITEVTNYICQRARIFPDRHLGGWKFKLNEIKIIFWPKTLLFHVYCLDILILLQN